MHCRTDNRHTHTHAHTHTYTQINPHTAWLSVKERMKAESGSSERSAGSEAEPPRAGVSRGLITGPAGGGGWGTSILRSGKGQGLEGQAGPPSRRQPPVPGERSGLGCLAVRRTNAWSSQTPQRRSAPHLCHSDVLFVCFITLL